LPPFSGLGMTWFVLGSTTRSRFSRGMYPTRFGLCPPVREPLAFAPRDLDWPPNREARRHRSFQPRLRRTCVPCSRLLKSNQTQNSSVTESRIHPQDGRVKLEAGPRAGLSQHLFGTLGIRGAGGLASGPAPVAKAGCVARWGHGAEAIDIAIMAAVGRAEPRG